MFQNFKKAVVGISVCFLVGGTLFVEAQEDSKPLTVTLSPTSKNTERTPAQKAFEEKDYSTAAKLFRYMSQEAPNNATVWESLGITLHYLNELEEANAAHRKAITLNPRYVEAWCNLGVSFFQLKRMKETIPAFEEAVRIDPHHAESWFNLGVCQGLENRIDEEAHAYREAIRIRPAFVEAWYNLGIAHVKRGENGDAMKVFREAIKIKPDFLKPYYNLGVCLGEGGELEEAIGAFRRVLRDRPQSSGSWYHLGLYLEQQGKMEESDEAFRKAHQLVGLPYPLESKEPAPTYPAAVKSRFPGKVKSPYAEDKIFVDVLKFEPGTPVKCPHTGKIFLVP
jgi:superkiller protein 3